MEEKECLWLVMKLAKEKETKRQADEEEAKKIVADREARWLEKSVANDNKNKDNNNNGIVLVACNDNIILDT